MNGMMGVGFLLNALVTLAIGSSGELGRLVWILVAFLAVSALGMLLTFAGARKPGATLAIIGATGFIPIGLVLLLGARKVLDQMNKEKFEKRRRQS